MPKPSIEIKIMDLPEVKSIIDEYVEVLKSHQENVRAMDVALFGEKSAAKQASLCDLIQPARSLRARAERMERELERMLGERILLAARIKKLETLEALAYKIQAAHLVHPDYVRTYGPCLCQICEFLRGERKT